MNSPRNHRIQTWLIAATFAGGSACVWLERIAGVEPAPELPPAFVYPEILGPTPAFHRVVPGETAAFEWEVVWPDGARPDFEAFRIGARVGALEGDAAIRGGWVDGRSVYRVELNTPVRGGYTIGLDPQVCVQSRCEPFEAQAAHALVAGGPAEIVVPAVRSATMAVGEVRPFMAYPAGALQVDPLQPHAEYGVRYWSSEPIRYAIDDPGVATVSPAGRVTALAVGETTLRITAGAAAAAVALTVADLPLAAPGEGRWTLIDYQVDLSEGGGVHMEGAREAKVAVDAAGWPRIALPFHPGLGLGVELPFQVDFRPLVLLRWTGTGFGHESLAEPWQAIGPPVLAVAGDGHEWFWAQDRLFDRLTLWGRPAQAEPLTWRRHELPSGPDLGFGEIDVSEFATGMYATRRRTPIPAGVWAGDDGAVAFGYATASAFANPYTPAGAVQRCPRMLFLANARPEGVEVFRVAQDWLVTVDAQIQCDQVDSQHFRRVLVMPPSFGSPHAGLVTHGGASTASDQWRIRAWRWTPTGWVGERPYAGSGFSDFQVQEIAPILPVQSAEDWFATEGSPPPLWLWYDSTGDIRADGAFPADAWEYAGHGVSDTFVYAFTREGPEAFYGELWMTGWAR